MNAFFSIIVPVYNIEKYLKQCISSILNQKFGDYEIILVDDGSTDSSGEICDFYQKQDKRIKVIHQKNGGQSSARNKGLLLANGKYVVFLDSDDLLFPDGLQQVYEILTLEKVELLRIQAVYFYDGKLKGMGYHTSEKHDCESGESFLLRELTDEFCSTVWSYIFNREFLLNNNLFFVEKIFHEDEQFMPRCILKSKSIVTSDCLFYEYRIRKGSTMTKKNQTKNATDLLFIVDSLKEVFECVGNEILKKLLFNRLVSLQLTAIVLGKFYHKKDKEQISLEFMKKHSYSKVNKLKVAICSISYRLFYFLEVMYLKIGRKR